jgi:hypothetical protein
MPFDTGLPLTTEPPDPIFDLTVRGQRKATYVFTLVEFSGYAQGEINPIRDSPPTLAHDTTRIVKRTLSLVLGVDDTARFDPILHRVDVAMKLSDGRLFPLGRYMPVSYSRIVTSQGDMASVALADEMFIIAEPLVNSFSCGAPIGGNAPYENVQEAVNRFLDNYFPTFAGIAKTRGPSSGATIRSDYQIYNTIPREIDPTSYISAGSWQLGTNGGQVLDSLSVDGDYFSPWINNERIFKMVRLFDPDTVVPTFDFDESGTVIRNSITRTDDFLNAANRIIVVSNSASGENRTTPIVGTFDIPSSAPHSIQNRGFVVAKTVNLQIPTANQAAVVARNLALRQQVVEKVELSTPPDPRHDGYDVIRFQDEMWLEIGWSMTLLEGAPMRHVLQRIFR